MEIEVEIHAALEHTLQHQQWPNKHTFDQFLRLLTWRQKGEPAFDLSEATKLQQLADSATWRQKGEPWVHYNQEELLILANRMRERLGLKLLKQDRSGYIEVFSDD